MSLDDRLDVVDVCVHMALYGCNDIQCNSAKWSYFIIEISITIYMRKRLTSRGLSGLFAICPVKRRAAEYIYENDLPPVYIYTQILKLNSRAFFCSLRAHWQALRARNSDLRYE